MSLNEVCGDIPAGNFPPPAPFPREIFPLRHYSCGKFSLSGTIPAGNVPSPALFPRELCPRRRIFCGNSAGSRNVLWLENNFPAGIVPERENFNREWCRRGRISRGNTSLPPEIFRRGNQKSPGVNAIHIEDPSNSRIPSKKKLEQKKGKLVILQSIT